MNIGIPSLPGTFCCSVSFGDWGSNAVIAMDMGSGGTVHWVDSLRKMAEKMGQTVWTSRWVMGSGVDLGFPRSAVSVVEK